MRIPYTAWELFDFPWISYAEGHKIHFTSIILMFQEMATFVSKSKEIVRSWPDRKHS